MEWHCIDSFDNLEEGSFDIEEPPAEAATEVKAPASGNDAKVTALVPGYPFDAEGCRLGFCGGF